MLVLFLRASAVALMIGLFLPLTTSAHANLDRSNPEAGAEINAVPERIELWFTEELAEGSTVEVLGPDGERVDNDDAEIDLFDPERKHLTATLAPSLVAGVYTVNWTSVSGEDDDSETGTFEFILTVDATPVASPVASPLASPAASPASEESVTRVMGQTQATEETSKPDGQAVLIALGAGLLAAVGIYLFWLMVKPRK